MSELSRIRNPNRLTDNTEQPLKQRALFQVLNLLAIAARRDASEEDLEMIESMMEHLAVLAIASLNLITG